MNGKCLFVALSSALLIQFLLCFKFYEIRSNPLEYRLASIIEKKTILFWSLPFGNNSLIDKRIPRDCGYCDVTIDRTAVLESSTAAVVFQFNKATHVKMPAVRDPSQYYVYFSMESPIMAVRSGYSFLDYKDVFNLTFTYRRDSDVYAPYGNMVEIIEQLQEKYKHTDDVGLTELMAKKKEFAIWIVSDCVNVPGSRQRLIFSDVFRETTHGRRLHRKGECFPNNHLKHENIQDEIREYKFYMALENSYRCRDYMTEEFFTNGFLSDTIPVVWGAPKEDYQIPEHSAIFAEDFDSAESLSDYMGYLDRNHTAYMEYFQWRNQDVTKMKDYGRKYGLCQLCRILHGINVDNLYYENHQDRFPDIPLYGHNSSQSRVVSNLHGWIFNSENQICFEKHLFVPSYSDAKGLYGRE